MKILLINSICGSGSTGRIVADLWKALKEEGHEAKVAYGFGKASGVAQEDLIKYNNKAGYYIHNAFAKLTDKTGLYSTLQTKYLVKRIKEFDPDVIHLHQLHGYHINYKVLFDYLSKADKKVVWTLHDCWAFTGHCAYFSFNKCDKWKAGCDNCAHMDEYPVCYLKGNAKRNFRIKKQAFTSVKDMTIVTPSRWLAEIVKESFLGQYPIEVIHNGIDLTVFKPTENDFKEKNGITDKKMVLAVANVWEPRKGLSDILRLAEMLDDNYKVVIVGLSEEQKKELPENIIGITRTNSVQELVKIYSAADVFVNFSVEETFGLVTAEAIACGTPVITYDKTAVPEIVDENVGIVVREGDLEKVLLCVKNLNITNPQKNFKYDIKINTSRHMYLYTSLLK